MNHRDWEDHMLCFACGHEMDVTQSEPHELLANFAYYSFKCSGCADTERRLLPRGRVPEIELLTPTTATPPPIPKPEEKIGRTEDHDVARDIAFAMSHGKLGDPQPENRLNEML